MSPVEQTCEADERVAAWLQLDAASFVSLAGGGRGGVTLDAAASLRAVSRMSVARAWAAFGTSRRAKSTPRFGAAP